MATFAFVSHKKKKTSLCTIRTGFFLFFNFWVATVRREFAKKTKTGPTLFPKRHPRCGYVALVLTPDLLSSKTSQTEKRSLCRRSSARTKILVTVPRPLIDRERERQTARGRERERERERENKTREGARSVGVVGAFFPQALERLELSFCSRSLSLNTTGFQACPNLIIFRQTVC